MNETKSTEQWVSLAPEFPTYEVSSTGLVRTVGHNSRILATRLLSSGGAPVVFLRRRDKDGGVRRTPRSLSKLVADAFVPNPHGATWVRFRDGDVYNAAASNLVWAVKERTAREKEKRTAGEIAQANIQQADMDKMSAAEQRAFFMSFGVNSNGMRPMPWPGVILKPLDIDPSRFSDYEKTLIKHGHVTYTDLPQTEQPE